MYSVNQVSQFYTVGAIKDATPTAVGDLQMKEAVNGWYRYFKYMGPGGLMSSDRIKKNKVKWVTYTPAAKMRKNLRRWGIILNTAVNGGNAVPGQDYIINFSLRNHFGMSDEDTYNIFASARAKSTSAKSVLTELAINLAKNLSREVDAPFYVLLGPSVGGGPRVSPNVNVEYYSDLDVQAITLIELEQPWELGRMKQTRPEFEVLLSPITVDGVEVNNWATVTMTEVEAYGYIGNGKETADEEWFFMGERADQYRGKDWPLSIRTKLLVDPDKEYDYLIVHYFDDMDNEGSQRQERDLILVAPADGKDKLKDLGNAIAAFAGVSLLVNGQPAGEAELTDADPVDASEMEDKSTEAP